MSTGKTLPARSLGTEGFTASIQVWWIASNALEDLKFDAVAYERVLGGHAAVGITIPLCQSQMAI